MQRLDTAWHGVKLAPTFVKYVGPPASFNGTVCPHPNPRQDDICRFDDGYDADNDMNDDGGDMSKRKTGCYNITSQGECESLCAANADCLGYEYRETVSR